MSLSRSHLALALALAASLAVNAILWARPTAAPGPPPRREEPAPVQPAPATTPDPALAACSADLAACRTQGWAMAWEAIGRDRGLVNAASTRADAGPPLVEDAGAASALDEADRLLLERTKATLRDIWIAQGAQIVAGLETALADPRAQDELAKGAAEAMTRTAKLHGPDAQRLEAEYLSGRKARVSAALTALHGEPPDVRAALDQVRGGYADEDRLMAASGGAEARSAWREENRETRAMVIALLATLADVPWDEAMKW